MGLSKPRGNPALTAVAFVLGTAASAALLSWASQLGSGTDQKLVDSGPFRVWVGVAAVASVAFVHTLLAGVRELRSRRSASGAPSLSAYGWLFALFAALVVTALWLVGGGGPKVDVEYWTAIRVGLLSLGVIAAGPWVISVWASHEILRQQRLEIPRLPDAASASAGGIAKLDEMMRLLLDIRKNIATAVGRLLILVMGAVLLSGALHAALVPDFVSTEEFPPSGMLAYGAFFTVMLSLAVLPLMLAWRQTATMLLDQAYPVRVLSTADDAAAKTRLSEALDLNGSLFRSPVTLSSLLAPLVTSFLAVFIPQLGQ